MPNGKGKKKFMNKQKAESRAIRDSEKERCKILDTYPDFSKHWTYACSKSMDEQIRLWQTFYMDKYPELLNKQLQCYETEKIGWREIAGKVFSKLPAGLQLMEEARNNILALCKPIYAQALQKLEIDFAITFVIYVGIGCGAGWATTYRGQPAILLGLENIAEEKWHTKTRLRGMISHEIGHLIHMIWRNEWETFEEMAKDPLFRLYIEGFAQRCEHLILGRETWHMAPNKNWELWCEQNKSWLAKEFFNRLNKCLSVDDFFGSWFDIQGRKQTGYFLGHTFICELEKTYDLRKIALLNISDVRDLALRCLRSIAALNE